MIAAAVLFLAAAMPASDPGRVAWCRSVAKIARVTAQAKRGGTPRATLERATLELPDGAARRAGLIVIEYAYTGNADDGLTPAQLGALVYGACLSEEGNL